MHRVPEHRMNFLEMPKNPGSTRQLDIWLDLDNHQANLTIVLEGGTINCPLDYDEVWAAFEKIKIFQEFPDQIIGGWRRFSISNKRRNNL